MNEILEVRLYARIGKNVQEDLATSENTKFNSKTRNRQDSTYYFWRKK
jgi:hypothetical protein